MRNRIHSMLVALLLFGAMSAQALPLVFTTVLAGTNEAPPNASPGSGNATVTIDNALKTMRLQAAFTNLTGVSTVAHIHCCTLVPGADNAGVATGVPTFPGFPAGVTSGSYDWVFDMTASSSYNPSFVTASGGTVAAAFDTLVAGFNAGTAYLNIHSSAYPGGEIRGFFQAAREQVPLPGTLVLIVMGIAGMSLGRRHIPIAPTNS
ncbi:MAG: CHRD domain-containing protein [Halioglobus sp.]